MHRQHVLVIAAIAAGANTGAASAQMYSVEKVGGDSAVAYDARAGVVAGASLLTVPEGSRFRGFRFDGAETRALPAPGYLDTHAFAVDADGDVYGVMFTIGVFEEQAFRLDPSGSVSTLGGFSARAANGAGVLAGRRSVTTGEGLRANVACIHDGGVTVDLPSLGGLDAGALGINDSGDVVGHASLPGDLTTHAVLWRGGAAHDLGTLGGAHSQAMAINESGRIAGVSATASGDVHACIFEVDAAGTVLNRIDLGVLSGRSSTAYDIDEAGRVVGISDDRAFLFDGGQMIDLNNRIPAGSGWVLQGATAIDDAGRIVGWGKLDNVPAAFLLDAACLADIDGSGLVDSTDFFTFITNFLAGAADLDGSGITDSGDFFLFIGAFIEGC